MLVRSAAFILAVLLLLGAFPAMRRADDAVAAQRSRWRVLYECSRATLAIAAAAAICLWILIGV